MRCELHECLAQPVSLTRSSRACLIPAEVGRDDTQPLRPAPESGCGGPLVTGASIGLPQGCDLVVGHPTHLARLTLVVVSSEMYRAVGGQGELQANFAVAGRENHMAGSEWVPEEAGDSCLFEGFAYGALRG